MTGDADPAGFLPGVRGLHVVTRALPEVGRAGPIHHHHVQMKPRDLKDADGSAFPDRSRGPVGSGIGRPRVGDELVDLLPEMVLLPSRADPGSPQEPAEVPGDDQCGYKAQGAECAQDPPGVDGLLGSGLGVEDGGA